MNKFYIVFDTEYKQYLHNITNLMGCPFLMWHPKKDLAMKFKTKQDVLKTIRIKGTRYRIEELIEEK